MTTPPPTDERHGREAYEAIHAVNYSTLKHILRSPAHYQDSLKEKDEEDELRFAVGTLAHAMILEGKDLRDFYAIKPSGMSFATKEGKAWRDAQTLPILKEDDANSIPGMAEAIANDEEASAILRACQEREVSVRADIQGVACKGRLDGFGRDIEGKSIIADIKTTRDARRHAFSKRIAELHYDFQCEWYSRLKQAQDKLEQKPGAVWIVVENKSPFAVACYYPEADVWASGKKKVERALTLLMKCREENSWPGYASGIKPISMPKWANREDEES